MLLVAVEDAVNRFGRNHRPDDSQYSHYRRHDHERPVQNPLLHTQVHEYPQSERDGQDHTDREAQRTAHQGHNAVKIRNRDRKAQFNNITQRSNRSADALVFD